MQIGVVWPLVTCLQPEESPWPCKDSHSIAADGLRWHAPPRT